MGFDVEQLRQTGEHDEGDAVIRFNGQYIVLEAKNEKSINLAGYVDEANTEAANFLVHRNGLRGGAFGVALVKRRGRGTGAGYAVLSIDTFLDLLAVLDDRD